MIAASWLSVSDFEELSRTMPSSAMQTAYGFPRSDVRLSNWRQAPWNVWAFRHVSELIPTARIAATPGLIEDAPVSADDLVRQRIAAPSGMTTIGDLVRETFTDAMVVMKSGTIVADFHAPDFTLQSRHILFSASKSVTAIVAGILAGDGALDPEETVAKYVPELKRSAFGDARVQDVLDMRVSLDFEETYQDPRGDFARYRRAGLLEPTKPGDAAETLLEFLASLEKGLGPHCGPFHYASPNSDVLGLVIERASGQRFCEVASARFWQPLGARQDAYVTVDAAGSARTGGGICMTARDLARIGEMMRSGGTAQSRRIVGQEWVRDTLIGGSADAWKGGRFAAWLPTGRYRNKWYQRGTSNGAFFALGIHGQWLYIDPAAEIVVAKFSSQPVPASDELKSLNFRLFDAIAEII